MAMKKILVTYATFAGSTVEVARVVENELSAKGFRVDLLPLDRVKSLDGYAGVVIGAPMIMGWHRAALGFVKKHQQALEHIPFAVFIMAMSLTRTPETLVNGVPVIIDAKLPKPPTRAEHLNLRERYARVTNYVQPVLNACRPTKPVSIGLFGGRLEYGRLKWWAVIFVMLIIRALAGDRRNWVAIQAWAADVANVFGPEPLPVSVTETAVQDMAMQAA